MARAEEHRVDVRRLLAAVEAAPPVDVVDVLAEELAGMVGADDVSLLLANLTGDAVVRLSHVSGRGRVVAGHNERVVSLPLAGSLYQEVLLSQQAHVGGSDGGGWLVLVPVTERGDAIGLLELSLPIEPDAQTVTYLRSAAASARGNGTNNSSPRFRRGC